MGQQVIDDRHIARLDASLGVGLQGSLFLVKLLLLWHHILLPWLIRRLGNERL